MWLRSISMGLNNGFTLIEMMIVVVIIAILASIAYPSYTNYVVKTNRTDMQAEMLTIASEMNAYRAANQTFSGATILNLYGSTVFPKQGNVLYDLSLINVSDSNWTLMATPKTNSLQKNNGVICLNDLGQKFWSKGATGCNLSNVSKWDDH